MEEEVCEEDCTDLLHADGESRTKKSPCNFSGVVDRIYDTVKIFYACYTGKNRTRSAYTSKRLDNVARIINPAHLKQFLDYLHSWADFNIQAKYNFGNFEEYIPHHNRDDGLLLLNLCISFLSPENEDLTDYLKLHPLWNGLQHELLETLRDCPDQIETGRRLFEEVKAKLKNQVVFYREEKYDAKEEIFQKLRKRGEYFDRIDKALEEYLGYLERNEKVKLDALAKKHQIKPSAFKYKDLKTQTQIWRNK